jgi:Cro/C1-type HTH DNA-binding domain
MNRPRSSVDPQLRIPPAETEIEQLFAGWRGELATCRKFAPAARNYAARPAGRRRRLADQRGPDAGPGRRAVGTGPVRGLWSGQPNTVRLDELDVICAVLGCDVAELLLPEPETVPLPAPAAGEQATAGEARAVTPRPRGGRSLPPR